MAEREDAAGYSGHAERNPRDGCPGGLGCAHGTHILFVFQYTSFLQKNNEGPVWPLTFCKSDQFLVHCEYN